MITINGWNMPTLNLMNQLLYYMPCIILQKAKFTNFWKDFLPICVREGYVGPQPKNWNWEGLSAIYFITLWKTPPSGKTLCTPLIAIQVLSWWKARANPTGVLILWFWFQYSWKIVCNIDAIHNFSVSWERFLLLIRNWK